VVCLVSPTAGAGLRTGAIYVLAALTYASVAAFCRTPARRTAAAVTVALLGLLQLTQALTAWLPGMDPSRLMIGTFFWHNQFGAYMLGTGLTAGVIAVIGDRTWRRITTAITPLCMAGVLLSGSRGSILVLAAGWLAVGGLAVAQRGGALCGVRRWLLVTALAAVAVTALTSSLFFARSAAPTAAVESSRRRVDREQRPLPHPDRPGGARGHRRAPVDRRRVRLVLHRRVTAHAGQLHQIAVRPQRLPAGSRGGRPAARSPGG
jgi:hypothetical protein